jgi:hypothetical protein
MAEFDEEDKESNVYGEEGREEMEENDAISPEEEAFMEGYEDFEEDEGEEEDEDYEQAFEEGTEEGASKSFEGEDDY